jgi:hypothetical protein
MFNIFQVALSKIEVNTFKFLTFDFLVINTFFVTFYCVFHTTTNQYITCPHRHIS